MTHNPPRSALAAVVAALAIGGVFAAIPSAGAASLPGSRPPSVAGRASDRPGLPQTQAARKAARWLGGQFRSQAFIPESGSSAPEYGETVGAVYALAKARVDPALVRSATNFLARHVNAYVHLSGTSTDQPGALANLIVLAAAEGRNPRAFGGTNLVSRLLATQVTTGADRGLFGAPSTSPGAYDQGLALSALAAVRHAPAASIASGASWLRGNECADGGWEDGRIGTVTPCPPVVPSEFQGPDTNTTSLAMIGLHAVGRSVPRAAVAFLAAGQTASAGWGYYPHYTHDADSTAEVMQGLLAAGLSPAAARFDKGRANPVSALLAMQITRGAHTGALSYEVGPHHALTADVLATYQAIPALLGEV
jgi:hypothetical protein